jgi:hypothetical protein
VGPAGAGQWYARSAFRNLTNGESFTATAMCDAGDILIGHYVAGYNINVTSTTLVDPLVAGAAAQGWRAAVTGTTGPPLYVNVTAICLDFAQ